MAIATVADVRAVDFGNHLTSVPDNVIQCILNDEAACLVGCNWGSGDKRRKAEALVAAHIAYRSRRIEGPAGPVTASSAGGLSRSFGQVGGSNDGDWQTTEFGRRYLRLRRSTIAPIAVLGCC